MKLLIDPSMLVFHFPSKVYFQPSGTREYRIKLLIRTPPQKMAPWLLKSYTRLVMLAGNKLVADKQVFLVDFPKTNSFLVFFAYFIDRP